MLEKITFKTKPDEIIDITDKVQSVVSKSKKDEGAVVVFVAHSTCAITTIEYEPGLRKDMPSILDKIAPKSADYEHNKTWGDGNGYSHIRASLIGPSLTVPFEHSELCLGRWQQIVLMELDTRPRERTVLVKITS
ncbi:MAG: secondary thiamine-phosphate synthase enzyme [Candidatus Aenigmarchaeota archaeon ex4484_14]|nr:MAG: secondary thiamine-phosphate synthase enzyme [Candidatus Aenigmarchaeota archaeon ex4484_14]